MCRQYSFCYQQVSIGANTLNSVDASVLDRLKEAAEEAARAAARAAAARAAAARAAAQQASSAKTVNKGKERR